MSRKIFSFYVPLLFILLFLLLLPQMVLSGVPDSDKDGVANKKDACQGSNTVFVDSSGCSCGQKSYPACSFGTLHCCVPDNDPLTVDCADKSGTSYAVCNAPIAPLPPSPQPPVVADPCDGITPTFDCTDSDEGLNYNEMGCVSYKRTNYPDECTSQYKLTERYCAKDKNGKLVIKSSVYTCPYGCDNAACKSGPKCGDDIIDAGEECDGNNLNGQSCFTLGFLGGGKLACALDCHFDTKWCVLGASAQTANKKNMNKYSSKEVFLISDFIWGDVLSLVSLSTWTDASGSVFKHPTLIFHEERNGFDADSIIYFLQQYQPDRVTIIGSTPQELDNLLVTAPSLGAGLSASQIQRISSNDYFSYWDSYDDVIIVGDNYADALMASTYASLINAPLVIERTKPALLPASMEGEAAAETAGEVSVVYEMPNNPNILAAYPDLIVRDFTFTNLPPTEESIYAYFDITISNIGDISVTLPVGMEIAIYKNTLTITNKIGAVTLGKTLTLNPSQNYTFSKMPTMQDAYLQDVANVSIRVDENKMVAEANETNNVMTKELSVCSDSDGGRDYYVKGLTSGMTPAGYYTSRTDYCIPDPNGLSSNTLEEYYCYNNLVYDYRYTCPHGCSDGACISLCDDSDGGRNYYVKGLTSGITTVGYSTNRSDHCVRDENGEITDVVEEYYCYNDLVYDYRYTCPHGCFDGACLNASQCISGQTQTCYTGPLGTQGVGICHAGTQACVNGQWGACVGQITPKAEICDGIMDEDCDGVIDEGCACINGQTMNCGFNLGECRYGTQTCVGGAWGPCIGGVNPTLEVCDGKDNDCDGMVDEGCNCINGQTRDCTTMNSTFGIQTCINGTWGSCIPTAYCGNRIIDPGEECDGDDLNSKTCTLLGFYGGSLSCNPATCTFDTSLCNSWPEHIGGNKLICVGNVVPPAGRVCNETYTMEELQQKYVQMTNTDKIILVNPNDLDIALNENFQPEKSGGSIDYTYTKTSLAAPLLASAKHEVIISSTATDYRSVGRVIDDKIKTLGIDSQYLTIVASPNAIQMTDANLSLYWDTFPYGYYWSPDIGYYPDIDGDYYLELASGRIFSPTISDVSSYISRSVFYDVISQPINNMLFTATSFDRMEDHAYIFANLMQDYGYQTDYQLQTNVLPDRWENKDLIIYEDHGAWNWAGILSNDIPYLSNTFVMASASATCGWGYRLAYPTPGQSLFCSQVLRKGGLGYIGSVAIDGQLDTWNMMSELFAEDNTIGMAIKNNRNLMITSLYQLPTLGLNVAQPNEYNPYILVGDPTFKPRVKNYLPKSDVNKLSSLDYSIDFFIGNFSGYHYPQKLSTFNHYWDSIFVKVGPFNISTRVVDATPGFYFFRAKAIVDEDNDEKYLWLVKYTYPITIEGHNEFKEQIYNFSLTTQAVDLSADNFTYDTGPNYVNMTFTFSNIGNIALNMQTPNGISLTCYDENWTYLNNNSYSKSFTIILPFLPNQTQVIKTDAPVNINNCYYYTFNAWLNSGLDVREFEEQNNYKYFNFYS